MSRLKDNSLGIAHRLHLAKALWGWVPHAGQAKVLMADAPVKVYVCGRRWGKTEAGAIDDVTSAIVEDGWESMVVCPSRDQALINYRAAKDLLERVSDFRVLLRCKETPHPEIMFGNRRILYRTAGEDGKYIRGHGKGLKRIRVDEAAYVKEEVIDGVIEPMCLDCGAQLVLQGTPFGKNHFWRRYKDGQAAYNSRTISFRFPSNTNPHLDSQTYEAIKRRLGEDSLQWKCEYLADFIDTASAVFPWELLEKCFYEPLTEKGYTKDFANYICGIDLARYSDYTVVVVGGMDRGMVHICDMDRFNEIDWPQQKARIYDIVQKYNAKGAADATGEGDSVVDDLILGEFVEVEGEEGRVKRRPGLMLEKVRITSNQIKRDLIDKLRLRMSQGLVKIPAPGVDDKWHMLLDELKYYNYSITKSGNVKFEAQGNEHDDIVMACALMAKKAFGNYEIQRYLKSYPENSWAAVVEEIERSRKPKDMIIGVN